MAPIMQSPGRTLGGATLGHSAFLASGYKNYVESLCRPPKMRSVPVSPPGTLLEPRARRDCQGEISRARIARPGKERRHVLPKSAAALQHFNPPARLLHICAWSSIYTVPLQLSFPSLPPLTQSCEHHCCSCLLLCSSARVAPLCRRHYQIKQ
jgi:hypothetical protein